MSGCSAKKKWFCTPVKSEGSKTAWDLNNNSKVFCTPVKPEGSKTVYCVNEYKIMFCTPVKPEGSKTDEQLTTDNNLVLHPCKTRGV